MVGDLAHGVIPRVLDAEDYKTNLAGISRRSSRSDTAGWAEPWEQLSGRILEGFTAIAKMRLLAGAMLLSSATV